MRTEALDLHGATCTRSVDFSALRTERVAQVEVRRAAVFGYFPCVNGGIACRAWG